MKFAKAISVLALTAILAGATGPAFAQRDTRPETDRPQIEHNGGGGGGASDHEADAQPRLRKATAGMDCMVLDTKTLQVKATNNTGADIPAGSMVTYYVQPGNVQKSFMLVKTWKSGMELEVILSAQGVALPAFCSIKISAQRGRPQNQFDDVGKDTFRPFLPGDTDAFDPEPPAPTEYEFTCELVNGGVLLTNTGDTTIKAGSELLWYVPKLYSTGNETPHDIPPGGSFFYELDDIPPQFQTRVGTLCKPMGIREPGSDKIL